MLEEILTNSREHLRRENVRLEMIRELEQKQDVLLQGAGQVGGMLEALRTLKGRLSSIPADGADAVAAALAQSLPLPDAAAMQNMMKAMQEMSMRSAQCDR
jgi:hypothetical protein